MTATCTIVLFIELNVLRSSGASVSALSRFRGFEACYLYPCNFINFRQPTPTLRELLLKNLVVERSGAREELRVFRLS